MIAKAPTLIFTWGNPSRGDDAIEPRIYDLLQEKAYDAVELLTDFQLQVEHAVDLEDRDRILFVDASASGQEPFEFYELHAESDNSYTTHALSPSSLLSVFTQVNHTDPPPAFMLSVRGYSFELGESLSAQAQENIVQAVTRIEALLALDNAVAWREKCDEATVNS